MTPKVKIRYSKLYDSRFNPPKVDNKELKKHLKKYKDEFDTYKRKIVNLISKITGLTWKDELTLIYPILSGRSFSNPVTIKIYSKKEKTFISKNYFMDKLVHELIHNIFVQNEKETYRAFVNTIKDYSNESFHTKTHIIVHAIHKEIYLKLFSKNRLNQDIKRSKKKGAEDYDLAWKIVNKEGYQNIIKRFRKEMKN